MKENFMELDELEFFAHRLEDINRIGDIFFGMGGMRLVRKSSRPGGTAGARTGFVYTPASSKARQNRNVRKR